MNHDRPPDGRLSFAVFLLACCSYVQCTVDWESISTPPRFIHDNNPKVLYFTVEKTIIDDKTAIPDNLREVTLHCLAEGNPKPTYKWRKNSKPFQVSAYSDKVVQKPGEGTLVFSKLDIEDAGSYACEATNDNGTAVARPIQLEQTWIRHFPDDEPEIVKVELGDPYARNCSPPASTPTARVYWILMGKEPGQFETINSSHISSNEQGTIFFHFVKESDFKPDRFYTCTAENTELKDYKFGSKFRLDISNNKRRSLTNVPPSEQYVNQSSPIALRGNTHKLHCFFSGYPAPRPKWFHNGVEIGESNDDGFRFENYGKTLVFNVTQDKAGKYDCRFPLHSDIDRIFNVQVEAAPYWPDGPPPNTNTSEGETVTFDCTTSGKPTPKVTFYKNGVELTKNKAQGERFLIDGNKLTIYDVKKGIHGKGDNAVYQCKAENKHDYLWANFYLNLLAFSPQLLTDAGEVEAAIGQSVTLECKFFASPNAKITWSSPNLKQIQHEIVPANPYGVGKLVIKSVTDEAEGEYECHGSNTYGNARGSAKLLIRKATYLEPFARTQEVRVAGEDIRLPCQADADSRLEVTYDWLIDNKTLPELHINSGHYRVDPETHELIVHNPSQYDSAEYKCVANTKLDKAEKRIRISIKDVPVPVHAAYVKKCDPTARYAEIHFEHMEPADSVVPVMEFWVQYQMDADLGVEWRTHPVPTQAHPNDNSEGDNRVVSGTATVSLQPYGKYQFRVLARNAVGDSSPTKVRDGCDTPAKLPDRNPSAVSAEGASPDNLVVSWKPMSREEWNGPNFRYKIKYRPLDPPNAQWEEADVPDPFADRYTINLEDDKDSRPFQPYEIQVQAVNDEGTSAVNPETIQGRTGEGVPSAIVEGFRVVSKKGTSATFAWNAIDPVTANGNFTGYKITYWYEENEDEDYDEDDEDVEESRKKRTVIRARRSAGSGEEGPRKKTIHFGPKVTQGTVTDLKPDTVNYATIAVTNGKHEGAQSDPISFRTDEGVPSPVRKLEAYPLNGRSDNEKGVVALRWKIPRQKNGKIAKYVVEICRTQDGKVISKNCPKQAVDSSKKEIRLTGLEPESEYRFVVRAETGVGEGDPNSADAKTLPQHVAADGVVPETPFVRAERVGEDHFNVSFQPGAFDERDRRPVGNSYKIQIREDGSEDWKTHDPENKDSLQTKVDGLQPGTKYEVRSVAAYSDPATGVESDGYSQSIFVTTQGSAPFSSRLWFLLLLLLIILLILIICCIICVAMRHRGQYPVSEKERQQGREPILPKQSFGEYKDDDEKRSLTGSETKSETDSMAEYGDDPGRFNEDGSFIGQYVPQRTLIPPVEPARGSTSTFV
ncbi:unnamed protein product, partial [Mesorhabditis belari]|uniref:Neuroglian n=1 Tax=Mesorhabditis belari TaxID=2138241 RepID=A0AAF3FF97_9BILA